ncbi:MAG: hypothetical protein IJ584_15405 [Bacteroidales bacterium]|nr:hypothetical protein [Bacteroidales bacterium]
MDKNSIQICNLLRSEKKHSELYLGCTTYYWDYSIVGYTADCTEALPLTLMDKTICGVLDLDGELTTDQLGAILGLNVSDNPAAGEYRDAAEAALLDTAIRSLLDYNMVERNLFSSVLRLTDIGREYYRQGKKFRTIQAKDFQVYFDRTTGVHGKAKKIFEGAHGHPSPAITPASFKDEQFLKSFIHEQLPDIYDPERGNSFTNVKSEPATRIIRVPVQIGVLYDVLDKTFRYVAVMDDKINKDLCDIIVTNDKLREELAVQVRVMLKEAAIEVDRPAQESFEGFLQDLPTAPEVKGSVAAIVPPVMEPEELWQGLSLLVGEKDKEVFIKTGRLGEDECKAVLDLCNSHPDTNVFLSYTEAEKEITDKRPNLFHIHQEVEGDYLLCTPTVTFAIRGFVLGEPDSGVRANMVFRYTDSEIDSFALRKDFAFALLPSMITDTLNFLGTDFEIAKRSVRSITHCDDRINVFQDFLNEETLERVRSRKQEVFNRVKIAFEQTLVDKLIAIIGEKDLDDITKVKELEEIAARVDELMKEGDETYINLMNSGRAFKQALKERDRAIKEELAAKTYIIDTNVFLDDPDILSKIKKPARVVLSGQVIQELDKKKNKADDPAVAANARKAVSAIKAAMEKDKKVKKDKRKFLVTDWADMSLLPEELQNKKGDNLILGVAVKYRTDPNPWMLTSDSILGITAESLGIPAVTLEDFYRKNGLEAPEKPGEKAAGPAPTTYMEVFEAIYDEKGYVLLKKFEKECQRYGITPDALGYESFIDLIEADPELTLSTNLKGVTYINRKR